MIAAVHHAAEALVLLADTEHDQLHQAVRARRIFVPTRTLPGDHNIPARLPPPSSKTPPPGSAPKGGSRGAVYERCGPRHRTIS